ENGGNEDEQRGRGHGPSRIGGGELAREHAARQCAKTQPSLRLERMPAICASGGTGYRDRVTPPWVEPCPTFLSPKPPIFPMANAASSPTARRSPSGKSAVLATKMSGMARPMV